MVCGIGRGKIFLDDLSLRIDFFEHSIPQLRIGEIRVPIEGSDLIGYKFIVIVLRETLRYLKRIETQKNKILPYEPYILEQLERTLYILHVCVE